MDSFETRNEFAAQDSDTASESQATDMQGNSVQAMNLRNADIVLRPDADGVVVLPEGASLDNMTAVGRDLVIVLDDGTRIVIPDGAIIVPQIVIDGVTVPAANLAALLTGNEPQPAAGDPQSSGGNFEVDPGNIQAAYALGDLLPYTQLQFPQPEEREIIPALAERDPDIVIETPDNPVGVINAIATVDEDGLPGRTIDGASEPEGTRSETNSETASGTIVFNAPDGVGSVLINGVAITSVGQTFQGETGTLTITSIDLASGRIGFSFTLQDNMVGGELDGSFVMSVIDSDGDRADANLQIRIIDDAPIAADDANSVAAGTFGPIAGSVLVNDEPGADGYAAGGPVTGFANDSGSAEPGDTLVGTYGELTLNADGSYSYTRYFNTPGGVSEEFTYTITDADGSTSTATLTIDIGDANDAITNVPDGEDETVVEEGQLPPTTDTRDDEPEGSDFDGDDETATGTITFTSPDGVGSVSVGGTVIDPTNLPQVVVSDDTGTLTVIDYTYDPVTGEGTITYEYELTDNTGDPEGTTVDFPIVVIDLDGDVAEDDLVITIIDDVPEAFDDTGAQGEENAPITVDALANDITGADGVDLATGVAVVDGTLSGDGSVAYNGDGTFTYTPGAGEEGTVTFDYTITDGDGDTSTATVTITLQPDSAPEIAVAGQDTVFEEALGARGDEPAGSNAASDGEFASGSITIATGGDSVDTLVINGVDVTGGGTVTTDRGVLTVSVTDGAYSYSYELTDNTLTDPDSDSFTLVVTDSDGDTAQTTLVVSIVDDNPSAADDANSIAAGEYGPVGGNVLANDVEGADGAVVTSYTGANGTGSAGDTIQGEYGTLTIAGDGSYSYTRNPGTEGGVSDSFTYTITDGDGDTATANLVIAIADSPVVLDLPVAGEEGTLVDEAGLPAGSDAASDSEFTSGTFTYDAPDGPAAVTIGGESVTAVGQTITGSFGTLTITSIANGAIGYTYELTTNTDGDDTFDSFEVTVTDQDGDVASGDLDIAIVDDVPTAVADTDSVTEDGPLTADGNVITNAEANGDNGGDTTGADGASVTDVSFGGNAGTVSGATAGAYGSLVLNANGSYTYTLDNSNEFVQGLDSSESLTEVFTYTLTDGDGDTSVTTLTVTINGDDDIVTINGLDLQTPELTVDEDDLADGSSPDAAALTPAGNFTVDSPDGLDTLTVGGVQVWGGGESYPISIPGAYGTVNVTGVTVTTDANGDVIAATVSYEYELSDNTLDHTVDGEDQLVDSLDVVATDSDGSQDTASLDIAVVDDVPTANDDSAGQGAENAPIVIDALANDVFGADGVLTADGVSVVVSSQGAQGTATYDPATGLFTYTPAPGAGSNGQLTDSFTYTITDQDGDSSTATVTVDLQPDSEPSGGTAAAAVDDDGLPGGNPDSTAGDLDANAGDDPADTSDASFTGALTFDVGNDGPATITFGSGLDGSSVMLGSEMVTYSVSGNTLTASSDRGDIFTVEITDPATGEYTVTLLQNVLHTAGNDENDALATIGFTVTDSEGETADTTLDITFDDDAPTATDNTNSVVEGATVTGNILTDDDGFGVDANGADGTLTILAVSGSGSSDDGAPFVVTGTYGELTVNADGSYSYESFANATNADAIDSFTYQIVDADGDISEAALDIDITNVAGTVEDDEATVNEAGLPTGSDAPSDSEIDADGQITVVDATGTFTYVLTDPAGGNYGTLTLDSVTGEYTYTLDTNVDGDSITLDQGGDNGTNTVTGQESFGYEVYDEFNNLIGSGTINVDIVDDVPTATDQALINVAEDAADISGNVMTDGTPDTEGADGASVTAITVGAQTVAVPQDGSDATLMTANGTYTIDMDGNWTFDPNPGLDQSSGAIVADFSYTLTDGDGDTDTATQPIRILDGTGPNDPEAVSLTVDDQNLADGSTPAGPDSDSETINFVPGSDPFESIVFGDTSGLDGGLTWARVDDFTITGSDGGRLVVTLTLNVVGDDATVTATLNDNYLGHASQGDELDALGSVDVIATDIDGDTATGSVAVNVSDDVPTLEATAPGAGSIEVDETDLGTPAGADFSGLFTPDYNADGPGSVGNYMLGLTASATGLVDTASGEAVVATLVGGTIEGRTESGGELVFTITVDADGNVELTQERAVVHADETDPDDATGLPGNLVTLTATVTDGDGDTADATANIGGAFSFRDDGPAIDASVVDGNAVTLTTQDAETIGAGSDTAVSTANFGGAFTVASSAYGADGAGSIAWDFSLAIDNAASGLTSDGVPVTLSLNGDVVEGRANGTLVFTVSVDDSTGEVTLTQFEEIDHDLPGSDDNYDSQLEALGDGVLSLSGTATITDGDGDTAEETVVLDLGGNIQFADDGPSIDAAVVDGDAVTLTTQDADTVGGTDTDVSIANFGGAFSIAASSYGADGAGSIVWDFSLTVDQAASNLSSDGVPVTLSLNGDVVEGRANGTLVFTLEVNETTGAVTLTQYEEIDHDLPGADGNYDSQLQALGNGLVTLSGTATITDGDGDTAEETVTLDLGGNVRFADDGPSIDAAVVDGDAVTLTTQDADTVGGADTDTSIADFGGAFSVASSDYGADGAGSIAWAYSLVIDNPTSGLTSGGVPVTLTMNGDVVEGRANGTLVFTAAVNGTTGVVTLTQYEVIDHDLPGDTTGFDSQLETLADGVLSLSGTATITDGDGDTAEETVVLDLGGNIRFADDGPIADPDTNSLTEDTASVGGNVIADDAFGADGAGDPAVTAVTGFNGTAGTVGGSTAGEFGTLSLNDDGTYTYTLNTAAVQNLDDGESEVDSFTYTIVDADGDTSTTTLDITITGANDAPMAENDTNWVLDVTVGADPTTSGNVLQDLDHPGAPSGSFADVADTDVDGDTLSVTGVTGGTVGASLAGTYGAIVINANGTYTYTLDSDNAAVDALGDGETLTDTFTYTVSDGDATDTATVEITIFGTNDAPVVGTAVAAVSDEGLAGGNVDGVGTPTDTTNSAIAMGTVTITDADGDAQTVTLGTPTSGALSSGGDPVLWTTQDGGQTLVGYTTNVNNPVVTITIDNDGDFTVTQFQQIDHPDTSVEDVDSIVIPVSSNDGTTTVTNPNAISVSFEDDSPIIGAFSPDDQVIPNEDGSTADGTFVYSPGGDGHGEFTITGPVIDGIVYQPLEHGLLDLTDDGVANPVQGTTLTGTNADGTVDIFTFQVDAEGNYLFTLLEPDAGDTETVSLLGLTAGGPQAFVQTPDGRIEFSSADGINSSTVGFGVANQFVGAGESFAVEFHSPGQPGNQNPLVNPDFVSSAVLTNDRDGGSVVYQITVYNDADGTSEVVYNGTITTSETLIDPTTLDTFNRFEVVAVSGGGQGARFTALSFTKQILPDEQQFDFDVSATDSDGDATAIASISVLVDPDAPSSMASLSKFSLDSTLVQQDGANDNALFASSSTATKTTSDPRMDMRPMEMATVAAMASGFFMPEMQSQFDQTIGDRVSADRDMVNFEFAPAAEVQAPEMLEPEAMSFDGFVQTDQIDPREPTMSNIMEGESASKAPQAEFGSNLQNEGVDFAQGVDAGPQLAGGPSVFEGFAGGDAASAMEALLMLEAPAKMAEAGPAKEPGKGVGETVAEIAAEAEVDAIVDHFAANDGPAMAVTPPEGLLDSMIGNEVALHAMGMMPQDQNDEAAALAAASA
ncbi:beta strand repeat-containing protein [Qipengyuania vulgaris]|nr:DUF5801 repeats-in-toxin domain-containing protein [Qipengyuania vulgaris]